MTAEGQFALYRCTKAHGSVNSPSSNLMKRIRIGDAPAQTEEAAAAAAIAPKTGRARIAAAKKKAGK